MSFSRILTYGVYPVAILLIDFRVLEVLYSRVLLPLLRGNY